LTQLANLLAGVGVAEGRVQRVDGLPRPPVGNLVTGIQIGVGTGHGFLCRLSQLVTAKVFANSRSRIFRLAVGDQGVRLRNHAFDLVVPDFVEQGRRHVISAELGDVVFYARARFARLVVLQVPAHIFGQLLV